jgi:hypothetical protein
VQSQPWQQLELQVYLEQKSPPSTQLNHNQKRLNNPSANGATAE